MAGINVLRILALTSFLLGVIYLFNAFSGVTGLVVADDAGGSLRGFFGVVFILIGAFSFLATRE